MDAPNRANSTNPTSTDEAQATRPAMLGRWFMLLGLPLLVVAVVGAGRGAVAFRSVQVLPAIHVSAVPADSDQAAPRARFDETQTDELATLPIQEGIDGYDAGVAYRVVETLLMEVTAYCPCKKCCGPLAHGVTASGEPVSYNDGKFVAADTRVLPFGSTIRIPGYADQEVVEVIDRGGAIKGMRLDVYYPSHKEALKWGRQILPVQVLERVDLADVR